MYNYSPIKKIYIKNFRNLSEVILDFTKSPIITLLGDNEAGKTSVIKAFSACALHASPREQKEWIRDNTNMFGVAIELEDGKVISRIKEEQGVNSYQIADNGTVTWRTNKITDGLPMEVQNLMGLIAEPETNEFLHVRTYEDKLLFIVTPKSTNYKVMYNALKVEQLTKALKLGSSEVNTLRSNINNNELRINTLQSQLKQVRIADTEPLLKIRDRLVSQSSLLDKIEKAKLLSDKIDKCNEQLGYLVLLDMYGLKPINELLANKLYRINNLVNRLNSNYNLYMLYNSLDSHSEIDTSILIKASNIINKDRLLKEKISKAQSLVLVNDLEEISELKFNRLNHAVTLINKLKDLDKQLDIYNIESDYIEDNRLKYLSKLQTIKKGIETLQINRVALDDINNKIEEIHNYMKHCGVAVESCPKCGEAVVFDIDAFNK